MKPLLASSIIALAMASTAPSTITYQSPAPEAHASTITKAEPAIAETIAGEATAYTSDEAQTDDTPDVTANGTHVHEGTIACPSRYAFGTKVGIEGKLYTCEDRMAPRYRATNRFDIWMASLQEARAWGTRSVTIIIYESQPSKSDRPNDAGY